MKNMQIIPRMCTCFASVERLGGVGWTPPAVWPLIVLERRGKKPACRPSRDETDGTRF